jgi:hypothetical protein
MSAIYFVWTTTAEVTRANAARINRAVQQVDPTMGFRRHYAPRNALHGWLERPNDGTNDYLWRRDINAKCIALAESALRSDR